MLFPVAFSTRAPQAATAGAVWNWKRASRTPPIAAPRKGPIDMRILPHVYVLLIVK
jgi:hypothetical protein